jgi:hypothetical protein
MEECNKCSPHLNFKFNYKPIDFIVGKKSSPTWIVGLNPKIVDELYEYDQQRTADSLENYFGEEGVHEYYKDFRKVSPRLHSKLGSGVACTDIVKCYSKQFPKGKQATIIINNCKPYLEEQLKEYKPILLICNGVDVCKIVKSIIPPKHDEETSYVSEFGGSKITIVLSGFIGRIDDYAKRRLGFEIERYI